MSSEEKRTMVITALICMIPVAFGILVYHKLPEQVPIHYNASWEPDQYAPKFIGIIALPFILIVVNCLVQKMLYMDQKKENITKAMRRIVVWMIPLICVVVQCTILFQTLGYQTEIQMIVPSIIGVLFIAIGNYFPKCRQNRLVGIRVPWTLQDEDIWNKTHHMAGYLWIVGGFIMLFYGVLAVQLVLLIVCDIAVLCVLPVLYSFFLSMKKSKNN